MIEITDLGLSSKDNAVVTIFHEIYHVRSNILRGHGGTEDAAEEFGQMMVDIFRRRIR